MKEMTTNDALELMKRPTYLRFIKAYDFQMTSTSREFGQLAEAFLAKVKATESAAYDHYESHSTVLNDMLQPVLVDLLRSPRICYGYLEPQAFDQLYQSRLIKNTLKEWGANNALKIGEEVASMFAWHYKFQDNSWFMNFYPQEGHQGGYRWDDDLKEKWASFLAFQI